MLVYRPTLVLLVKRNIWKFNTEFNLLTQKIQITKSPNSQKWLKKEALLISSHVLILAIFMMGRIEYFFQRMRLMSPEMRKMQQNVLLSGYNSARALIGCWVGIISFYYMTSSASGQDEPNRALWLATWAGKMEPSCPLGTTRCIPQAKFPQKPYNKSFIDQVCSVKIAGYWPCSFLASLWT